MKFLKAFEKLKLWASTLLRTMWQYVDGNNSTAKDTSEPDLSTTYRRFRKRILRLGTFIAPSAIGIMIGYVFGYRRTLKQEGENFRFHNLPKKMRRAMFIGGVAWILLLIIALVLLLLGYGGYSFYGVALREAPQQTNFTVGLLTAISSYLLASFVITWFAWESFLAFLYERLSLYGQKRRYGSAKFSMPKDLTDYLREDEPASLESHIYMGSRDGKPYVYKEDGHGLIVAGTRAGKGTNFIMPNLLGKAQFNGSWVVVDPKGESYWYTHEYHRKNGRKVVIINPWGVHELGSDSLNPLDAFADDPERKSLGNDMRVIAENIIPMTQTASSSSHFNDRARTLIMAMLMHLILAPQYKGKREIATLFTWFSDLDEILQEMTESGDTENHVIVSNHARQFLMLMEKGEREFASVLSTAQRALETFADRELMDTMKESKHDGKPFDIRKLAHEKMIIYIIIPPENLKTHGTWLRLMVSNCLRAVLRYPRNRVGFILDEFYALGYMPDIEVGMGAYAGYKLSLFPILQSISQLQHHYPKTWENFVANSGFFNAFGLNDNTTTAYISRIAGKTSNVLWRGVWESTPRDLVTADEVRRGSATNIFSLIDKKPLAHFDKLAWFDDMEQIGTDEDGKPIPFKSRGNPEPLM